MVRQSKTPATPAATSATPVVQQVAPAVSETPAKKVSKKAAAPKVDAPAPVVATPAPAPVAVAPAAPVDVAPAAESESSMATKLNVFGAKLQQLAGLFSSIKTDFKLLEKSVSRELKNAQKTSSRKKKSTGHRQPSGFVKPTRISDELARFLGKEIGTEMARTDVSREINAYIRDNGLQDKANGRKINADSKLFTLLKLSKEDELTYFNLQKFMKHHFIKPEVVATA